MAERKLRLVGLTVKHEDILDELIDKGYYGNKTEAIRAGVMALGEKYEIIRNGNGSTKKV
jgi:Arc/MetJ-type ribon-helix-helix transcriptional regulator